jgi:protein TonB
MRTYTLAFSIVAHLVGVAVLVVAPLFATGELPDPHIAIPYIQVVPTPMPPPPAIQRSTGAQTQSKPDAAPVVAPTGFKPESGIASNTGHAGDPFGDPRGVEWSLGNSVAIGDPPPPPAPPPTPKEPVRVGGSIRPPQKIRDARPVYPAVAQEARIHGIVILEAVIGEDGHVRSLRVLRSIPLLDQAATDAVRQWVFTPTLLNGQPVPVAMTVTVAFHLQ